MNKILYLFLLFLLKAAIGTCQTSIDFQDLGWTDALDKGRLENKLVFVSAYVDWSGPCEEIEKYTYTDPEVAAFFNEHFINIRMDMEVFPGVELTEFYKIYAFPALLFVNHDGQVVHRGCGALESAELLTLGQDALGENRIIDYQNKFATGERSPDFLVNYTYVLDEACMSKDAFVNTYFKTEPRQNWTGEASWAMIVLNITEPYSEPFQYLVNNRQDFISRYGKDTVDQKIYEVLLDQFIEIYEESDFTLFAVQAMQSLLQQIDFNKKGELKSMVDLKYADLKEDWELYGPAVLKVIKEQEVDDPVRLNEFAWKFYLFIDHKEQLTAAKTWMKQVIDDYDDATYLDTYASLLYKLGEQKEAVKYAKKALKSAGFEQQDLMHYEAQLEKFGAGY